MKQIAELADCWNKIGVTGDGSCAELAEVVHCRNCQVYSAAGGRLLDRPPPPDYRRDWTEHFARAKAQLTPGKISVLVFRIGAEWLALPSNLFQEILEQRVVHSLPHRRNGILLGLINVRGELLVCVSLERLLGVQPTAGFKKSRVLHGRLLVTEWQGSILAFPVDEIQGIHRYHPEELKSLPATVANAGSAFTRGLLAWQDRLVGCLDGDVVFSMLNRSLA